ncbi:MAG TPA: GntR family transcriptional regulator [Streptosporangiaceae bacterium]|nr:GntR family transcriptional regulator [Streptosporangiaceae bacterium]
MAMEPVTDRDLPDRDQVEAVRGRRPPIRQIGAAGKTAGVAAAVAAGVADGVPAEARPPDALLAVPGLTQAPKPGPRRADTPGGRASGIWHPRLPGRKPPKLVRGPGVTVHGQIEDWLADAIAAGRLAPGDRLPTEQDLAAWLGVSRMTLRHALGELAQRGLVIRAVGRSGGTFVAEPKVEQDLTVLAGFSEQLRRHGLVAGARVLAAAEIKASPAASAALEISVGAPVYEVRRLRLAGGQPILIEHSLFPAERCPGLLGYRLDGSLYELLEEKYGERPHRAKESLEPVCAGVREAEALGVAEGAPLMLVERTAYSRADRPLEFAHDLFRGDRTKVVVWTSELAGEI